MSAEQIQQNQLTLASIQSNNPAVMEATLQVNQYTEMCKAGQLSPAEYIELIEDIQRMANINQAMIELENLQKLNTAINSLITIAKLG